jgi:hypothetical protein
MKQVRDDLAVDVEVDVVGELVVEVVDHARRLAKDDAGD